MYEQKYIPADAAVTAWWPDVWKPTRPFAADDLVRGTKRMSRVEALLRRHVEVNQRVKSNIIAADVDHPDALLRLSYVDHPMPNLVVENPTNGHAHGLWVLGEGVTTTDAGRWKPLVYLSDVTEGLRRSVDGDPAYAGFITKNPVHQHWQTWWMRPEPYSLGELQTGLRANGWMPKFGWHRQVPVETLVGIGRNCSLFDTVRRWAYRAVRQHMHSQQSWNAAVHEYAATANGKFTLPLPTSEVRSISRSVSRWVWKQMAGVGADAYDATFVQMQTARSARAAARRSESAQERWAGAAALKDAGMTHREIGDALGISERAVEGLVYRRRGPAGP